MISERERRVAAHRLVQSSVLLEKAFEAMIAGELAEAWDHAMDAVREAQWAAAALREAQGVEAVSA